MRAPTYRAKCDDIAVHVRGEALPYKTIKELRVERTRRRTTLHLVRSEDIAAGARAVGRLRRAAASRSTCCASGWPRTSSRFDA